MTKGNVIRDHHEQSNDSSWKIGMLFMSATNNNNAYKNTKKE